MDHNMLHRPTAETIRADILARLDDVPEDDENLLDYGLNSISFMALTTRWQANGLQADFNILARNPTISAILAALSSQLDMTVGGAHHD